MLPRPPWGWAAGPPRGPGAPVSAALSLPLLCPHAVSSLPGIACGVVGPVAPPACFFGRGWSTRRRLPPRCPSRPLPPELSPSYQLAPDALFPRILGGAFVMLLPFGLTVETPLGLED